MLCPVWAFLPPCWQPAEPPKGSHHWTLPLLPVSQTSAQPTLSQEPQQDPHGPQALQLQHLRQGFPNSCPAPGPRAGSCSPGGTVHLLSLSPPFSPPNQLPAAPAAAPGVDSVQLRSFNGTSNKQRGLLSSLTPGHLAPVACRPQLLPVNFTSPKNSSLKLGMQAGRGFISTFCSGVAWASPPPLPMKRVLIWSL